LKRNRTHKENAVTKEINTFSLSNTTIQSKMSTYNNQRDQRNHQRDNKERYIPRDAPHHDNQTREEPVTHPSICIPRTFTTIRGKPTKAVVFNTLRDLKVGHIERIDVVQKTDSRGERYCTIYVHMQWNMRSELARDTRQKLLDGSDVKIVYDDPWFWKCSMSTMEKPEREGGDGGRRAPRPRIDLGDGIKAVSRYTCDVQEQQHGDDEQEQHNSQQLCNMDPNEESD
jgi:hypothetical protein